MTTYLVQVLRCSVVWERGYLYVQADSPEEAKDLACEEDDPEDMTEISADCQNHEYEVVDIIEPSEPDPDRDGDHHHQQAMRLKETR